MPEKPLAEKTEQPTPRKLKKARQKGQVAQSQELPAAVSIVVLIIIMVWFGRYLGEWFSSQVVESFTSKSDMFASSGAFISFANRKIANFMLVLLPVFGLLTAGSVISCASVSGLNFAPEALKLKFNEINPVEGFRKLFDVRSLVRLCTSIAKIVFVSLIVWFYLQSKLETLTAIRWAWTGQIAVVAVKIITGLMVRVALAVLVIAAADVIFQKWKHLQDMKMTRQEVKKEMRDSDGSPELKSHIRKMQMEMSNKRMLQDVPTANVVLVNPTHVAVALKYDVKAMNSPVVVAKGADLLCDKIKEVARAYGVPIVTKPPLARNLFSTVKIGGSIPQDLYIAVAEILAMIYRLKKRSG